MAVTDFVRKAVTPAARVVSAAITMRLVGYAIVRKAVGVEGLQRAPWGMGLRTIQRSEADFRRFFGMPSEEWVEKYAGQLASEPAEIATGTE